MKPVSTESIWRQLSADLRRFLRRRVADDHTAEDLLQETFVRIHRSLSTLKESDRLAGWVYRIARNVLHDHQRRKANAGMTLDAAESVEEGDDREEKLRRQASQWLHEFIGQIPEGYREAVLLSEIEGLPQQEVATRLGLSLSGAKSRIQRGRSLLKEELERCCTFELDRRGNVVDYEPRPDRKVCRNCDEPNGSCPN